MYLCEAPLKTPHLQTSEHVILSRQVVNLVEAARPCFHIDGLLTSWKRLLCLDTPFIGFRKLIFDPRKSRRYCSSSPRRLPVIADKNIPTTDDGSSGAAKASIACEKHLDSFLYTQDFSVVSTYTVTTRRPAHRRLLLSPETRGNTQTSLTIVLTTPFSHRHSLKIPSPLRLIRRLHRTTLRSRGIKIKCGARKPSIF